MGFNTPEVVLQSISSTRNKRAEPAPEEVELMELDEEEEAGTNEQEQVITLEEEEKLLNADDFEDEMMVVDVDQNNMTANDNVNSITEERCSGNSNVAAGRSKEIMENENLQRQRDINAELVEYCTDETFSEYINNKPTWEEYGMIDATPHSSKMVKKFPNTLSFTTTEEVSN